MPKAESGSVLDYTIYLKKRDTDFDVRLSNFAIICMNA